MKQFIFTILYYKNRQQIRLKTIKINAHNYFIAKSNLYCLLAYKYGLRANQVITIS